jgi:hypothetical protein
MGVSAEIDALPYVDEHAIEVAAPPARTWEALGTVTKPLVTSGSPALLVRALGCEDPNGFHLDASEAPTTLALVGSHRFSRYALVFHLDPLADPGAGEEEGRTRLRAETRAEFPGLHGRAYRALVIGTRLHVLATRRVLGTVAKRAERPLAVGRGSRA